MATAPASRSRYILTWEGCLGVQATGVERTVQASLQASSLMVEQRPRILSDKCAAYISWYLKECLKGEGIGHDRSAASAVRFL